jgi:putative SOS response-associated peptidase YedK
MCGRFSLAVSKERVSKKLSISVEDEIIPNYNIAPTQNTYVITNEAPKELQQLKWGLIPYWAKDEKTGSNLINARSEGVASKPSFRMPIRKRRCLVIADGFYEWRKEGRNRIPYRIKHKHDSLIIMAGIWDKWVSSSDEVITSFSILTTTPNKEMSYIHDRMPVIINNKEQQEKWLNNIDLSSALSVLQTLEDDCLDIFPVSKRVNSVSFNEPSLFNKILLPPTLFD